MGHGSIVLLLTVAATYAMATLFFEWRHECWPSVRSQWIAIDEAKEAGKNALIYMEQVLEESRSKISLMAESTQYFENGLPSGAMEFISRCIEDIENHAEVKLLSHPSTSHLEDELAKKVQKQKINREIESIKTVSGELKDKINSSNHIYNHYYENDIIEMKKVLSNISKTIGEVKYHLEQTKLSLYIPFTIESARVMGIGMITPLSLYILAITHAVGAVGFPIFGKSWVVFLLRHFN